MASSLSVGFYAPTGDHTSMSYPEQGAIILDGSDFTGNIGTPTSQNWIQLSGSSGSAPRSEVWVDSGNGFGSTNTKIRRFSNNSKATGTAITYADSATLGASFTINEDGLYSMSYTDGNNATVSFFGFSVDSSQLTTDIQSITAANRIQMSKNVSTDFGNVGATVYLSSGQVVRAHAGTSGSLPNYTSGILKFIITKVNN